MRRFLIVALALSGLSFQSACTPIGMAAGAGAAAGIAAARDGGISGAASDLAIKAKISDKWFKYDLNTFAKLNLTVDDGRVLITGVVQDPDARVEAVRLAWQVDNVKQVINEIRIAEGEGLPGYIRDQWITAKLRAAITFDKEIQSINYSIDTVQGTVYLMGIAHSQSELNRLIEVARSVTHVKQVISYVKMTGEDTADTLSPQADAYQPTAGEINNAPADTGPQPLNDDIQREPLPLQ